MAYDSSVRFERILLTGCTGGIGQLFAAWSAEHTNEIVLIGRDLTRLKVTGNKLSLSNSDLTVSYQLVDFSRRPDFENFDASLFRGQNNLLINAAGYRDNYHSKMIPTEIEFNVNFFWPTFLATRLNLLSNMNALINVGSGAATRIWNSARIENLSYRSYKNFSGNYAFSKFLFSIATWILSERSRGYVNLFDPGTLKTQMTHGENTSILLRTLSSLSPVPEHKFPPKVFWPLLESFFYSSGLRISKGRSVDFSDFLGSKVNAHLKTQIETLISKYESVT